MALSLPPQKIGVFNLDSYPPVINCGWAIPGLNGGEKNGKINELNGGQVTTLKKMPCHVCHVVQCKERPFSILSPEAIVPYMGRLAATGWVPASEYFGDESLPPGSYKTPPGHETHGFWLGISTFH